MNNNLLSRIDINNKTFWNIFKGLSILSIVIGHCCYYLVPFVYLYHLVVFFFAGGYFYNEDKYGFDPGKYFLGKLKNNWIKFFTYSFVLLLFHNLFFKLGMIINTTKYSFSEMITAIVNTSLFFGTESFGGAMWFIPVYIIASLLFGIIIYFSNKVKSNGLLGLKVDKNIFIIISSILCGIIGYYFVHNNLYVMLHIHTSFLVVPFFTIGYYVRNNVKNLRKYLNIIAFIMSFGVLLFFAYRTDYWINLTDNITGNILLFYLISLIGIYFVLYLSNLIYKIRYVNKYFEKLGIYSFEIMAFHFVIFKMIDFIYSIKGIMNHTISSEIYGIYPYAFRQLWPIYIILGATVPMLVFLIFDKAKKQKKIISDKMINIFSNKKTLIGLFIVLIICVGYPILKCGIMHNDELMSRLWSLQGFPTFYLHYFHEQIEKGRALSSFIIPLTQYLGFIGQKSYQFRIMQIISIFCCLAFMCNFLKRIFADKKMILLYALLFISFLQISFEPTVPNVFVTFYNISICALLFSFTLYVDYLDTGNTKKLLLSSIIFFIVELTYESFLTYTPLFALMYIYKKGFKNLFKDLKALIMPISVGILYLVLYIICSRIFPSNYTGNQIASINIFKSLNIIGNLGFYSFPGSYLISDKYQFLFRHYLSFNIIDIVRLCLFLIPFIIIFFVSVAKDNDNSIKTNILKEFSLVLIGMVALILPLIPISVASMYQQMEIGKVTFGLPVSFFSYFAAIFICTIVISFISKRFKTGKYIIFIALLILVVGVQSMNSTFSREAKKDFARIEYIERFLSSGIENSLEDKNIYSTDLFICKNALFVHNDHWNNYLRANNIDINVNNSISENSHNNLYFNDVFGMFVLNTNNKHYLITDKKLFEDAEKSVVCNDDIKLNDNFKSYEIVNEDFYHFIIGDK